MPKVLEILGVGCPKCRKLKERVEKAVEELGWADAKISSVSDMNELLRREAFVTPALAIDGKIVVSGHVPTTKKLMKILQDSANNNK